MEKLMAFGIEFLHHNEFLTPTTKYEFSNAINHLHSIFHARPLNIVKMDATFTSTRPCPVEPDI
jgi:hypothetical protein